VAQSTDLGEHEAVFSSTLVYYVFSFSASEPLDVNAVADRLLAAQVAETVGSPAREDVRVSPRYRDLVKTLHQAEALAELDEVLKSKSGLLSWARRRPRLAARILPTAILNVLRPGARTDDAESAEEPLDEAMRKTIEDITLSVADAQALNAIQQFVEARLFEPDYLVGEPYLRLRLRETHQMVDLT
jgi:hypothetical protein